MSYKNGILHLNLKKQYFRLIENEIKKEEYRALTPYWGRRLTKLINFCYIEGMEENFINDKIFFREYKTIIFSNGYSKSRKQIAFECKGIKIGIGREEWGAKKQTKYFVIKLGNKLKL